MISPRPMTDHEIEILDRARFYLYQKVNEGDLDAAKQVIKSGADLNSFDRDDQTILHTTVHNGHTAVVKLLSDSGIDPNVQGKYGFTPLSKATKSGYNHVANTLLDRLDRYDEIKKHYDIASPLIKSQDNIINNHDVVQPAGHIESCDYL